MCWTIDVKPINILPIFFLTHFKNSPKVAFFLDRVGVIALALLEQPVNSGGFIFGEREESATDTLN